MTADIIDMATFARILPLPNLSRVHVILIFGLARAAEEIPTMNSGSVAKMAKNV
jgi:hypothetical protein